MPAFPTVGAPADESTVARPAAHVAGRASVGELVLVGALVLGAAAVRLVSLPARGMWDADQGTEMLVLLRLVRDHVVPLLGPPTSIGDFHHGVLAYWLLAPAAFVSGADPTVVAGWIAVLASCAVVPVWWLARSVAGVIAGAVAALLYATSATGIAAATVIWNPDLAPLPAAVAFASAWHAALTGRLRSWLVAAAALAVTIHTHVLAAVLIVPFAGLVLAAERRRAGGVARAVRIVLASAAIVALSYVPLLVYDAGHGWSELRAVAAYVADASEAGGGPGPGLGLLPHVVLVALRVAGWPLSGLVTVGPGAPAPALVAILLVGLGVAFLLRGSGPPRAAGGWFAFVLAWCVLALVVAAPALTTVVAALPVDQYHGFVDPLVVVCAAIGIVGLASAGRRNAARATASTAATLTSFALAALVVAWNALHWPPLVSPDGGWPAADAAAARIEGATGASGAIAMLSLPSFKAPDAYAFPLERRGRPVVDVPDPTRASAALGTAGTLVVLCDATFDEAIGARCGGDAEASLGLPDTTLVDRFEAAPGRWISVYSARTS